MAEKRFTWQRLAALFAIEQKFLNLRFITQALKEFDAEKRLVKLEEARRAMKEALRLAVEQGIPTSGTL